jgi:hypothetical protein
MELVSLMCIHIFGTLCICHISSQDHRINHKIKTANKSFKNVTKLEYLRTTARNQNNTDHEVNGILISVNIYHPEQYYISPYRNVKIILQTP